MAHIGQEFAFCSTGFLGLSGRFFGLFNGNLQIPIGQSQLLYCALTFGDIHIDLGRKPLTGIILEWNSRNLNRTGIFLRQHIFSDNGGPGPERFCHTTVWARSIAIHEILVALEAGIITVDPFPPRVDVADIEICIDYIQPGFGRTEDKFHLRFDGLYLFFCQLVLVDITNCDATYLFTVRILPGCRFQPRPE